MPTQEQFDRYSQFLESDPQNIRLLTDTANCAHEMGHLNDVIELTSRGLQVDPGNRELRASKALATLGLGNFTEAAKLLQQLVDEGENAPAIRYNLAYCLALSQQYPQALALLEDAETHYAELPQMVHLKVKALHFMAELEQAIALCQRCLQQQPQDAVLHGALSTMYIDTTEFGLAKQHAELAMQSGSPPPEAETTMGVIALSDQDDATALVHFEKAIAAKQNSGRAWLGKAMSLMMQQQLPDAEQSYNSALQYMPNHLGTWQGLAWCQIAANNLDGAEQSLQKALEIDDTFAETHGALAVIAVLRGDTQQARTLIRRSLGIDHESFSGLFAQALLLKQQGKVEASQKLINTMLDEPILPDQRTLRESFIKHMSNTKNK
jgi:tetratricopeptide (TPR) repeat protein